MRMKTLDLMIQEQSPSQGQYEFNRTLIQLHLDGELSYNLLPQHLQDMLWEWELDSIDISSYAFNTPEGDVYDG